MKTFAKHCVKKNNIVRSIKFGIVVGALLGVINHYDMFLPGGMVTPRRIFQIILTALVPFFVSLFSSALHGRHYELNLGIKLIKNKN